MLNGFWRQASPLPPTPPAVTLEAALPTLLGALALLLLLLLLRRLRRRAAPQRETTVGDGRPLPRASSFDAPEGWDDDDFEITFSQLFRRRLRQLEVDPSKLLGSIVTQLGQRAFFFISSVLAVLAVSVQYVLSRVRSLDGAGLVRVRELTERMKSSMQTVLGKLRYEALATKLYGAVDDDGDGIDPSELYSLTLEIYLKVTQFVPQVLTPPTKAHTDRLFATFDLDQSRKLDRDEFVVLASLLYESLALRIAAQSALSLVIAPTAASYLAAWLGARALPGGLGSVGDAAFGALPPSLRPYVGNQGVVVAALAATLVAVSVPFAISLIDEFYLFKSKAKAKRALRAHQQRLAAAGGRPIKRQATSAAVWIDELGDFVKGKGDEFGGLLKGKVDAVKSELQLVNKLKVG